MPSVRELKTKWQLRFYDASREPSRTTNSVRKSEYTRAQAEKEADWREQLYERGEYDPWTQERPSDLQGVDQVTVGEAIERYVSDKREAGERGERRGWSKATATNAEAILSDFARRVGRNRLAEHVSESDLRQFIYRSDLSDASKRSYHGLLSAWARWMAGQGLPAPEIPPEVETVSTLPAWASKEQLATIVRAFRKICKVDADRNDDPDVDFPGDTRWWMADAWQFAFWQGLRKQEVVAIRVGGVDLDEMQMVVGDESFIPKGRREDVIPLSGPAAEIAREWGAQDRHDGERLFRHSGADKLSKAFTQARAASLAGEYKGEELPEDAQLESGEDLTLHSLRHGRAIDLIRQRRHVVYVSQYLRHSSLEVTREYLQVVPRHLHDEIRQLDEDGIEL